jgi:hypothetical protein
MKLWLSFLALSFLPTLGFSAIYDVSIARFTTLTLTTDTGKEEVIIEDGNKEGSQVVFRAKLTAAPGLKYVTAKGTTFQLVKLADPVVHDSNRKINSGDWKIIVTGSGPEFERVRKWRPSFGDSGKNEYFGTRREE